MEFPAFVQIAQLEAFFNVNEYIDGERKKQLSRLTNIPEQQIKVWFQNRRQKKKREVEEMQQQALQQERMQQARITLMLDLVDQKKLAVGTELFSRYSCVGLHLVLHVRVLTGYAIPNLKPV